MGCCSREDKDGPQGMVTEGRGCTDIICLLLFGLFWGGMGFVGYEAIAKGSPERILYGLDSYGNYCGSLNVRSDNITIDLRKATKLLYLNPLELLDTANYQYATAVCVESCPTISTICNTSSLPCTQSSQYVCPYYAYSQFGKNSSDELGILSTKGPASTDWWGDLLNYGGTTCVDTVFLSGVPSEVADAMNATSSCGSYYQTTSMYPGEGPCSAVFFETTEFMHRCYPIIPEAAQGAIASVGTSGLSAVPTADITGIVDRISQLADGGFNTYVTDAQRGFTIILACGLGAALVMCLLYMFVLRFFAGAIAWTVVILVNLLFIVATILAAYKSGLLSTVPGTDGLSDVLAATGNELAGNYQVSMKYMTYILCALTTICIIMTLLMIRRIAVAVACLKVAAAAIGTVPSLIFFPLITFSATMLLFIYWVIVFAHQWSAGTVVEVMRQAAEPSSQYSLTSLYETSSNSTASLVTSLLPAATNTTSASLSCYEDSNCYYDVKFSAEQQYMFAYHLFGLLWTNQVINGFGYIVIAHSVGQYYWTRGLRSDMTTFPVLTGLWVATRYHIGSVAFGGFIVAVIQFVRLLLEYMDRKTKQMQKGNPAARWIMCCLRYCLWYLEKVMKFINRNAYIIVAVKGYTFCGGAMRAIKLIILNVGRLAAVNVIGDALIFLGKLSVVMACGSLAFLMTDMADFSKVDSPNYLSSPIIPVLLTMLAAYMVASVFFAVYEMAVDTILLSFCEDCTSNNEVPQFAPKLLMSALGKAKTFQDQQESKAKIADKNNAPA